MFHTIEDYLNLPRDKEAWIVKDIVPRGGFTYLYSKPKTGKSFAALQLADAIANPATTDWLSFPIRCHGEVCYLQLDTPRSIWAERLERCRTIGGLAFEGVRFADAMDVDPYPMNILDGGFRPLQEEIAARQPVVLIVDTLREIHGGDENDSGVMRNVVAALRGAAPEAALLLIAHARKEHPLSNGTSDLMDEARGSTYLVGRMDIVMRMTSAKLYIKGRTIGETDLAIVQEEATGLVRLADSFTQRAVEIALKYKGSLSQREMAQKLVEEMIARKDPRHLEACRSLIRRVMVDEKD